MGPPPEEDGGLIEVSGSAVHILLHYMICVT